MFPIPFTSMGTVANSVPKSILFGPFHQHHELALQSAVADLLDQFGRGATQKLFEFLGEFAREHDPPLRHDVLQFTKQFLNAIWRLVKNERARNGLQPFQLRPALAGFVREKTEKVK